MCKIQYTKFKRQDTRYKIQGYKIHQTDRSIFPKQFSWICRKNYHTIFPLKFSFLSNSHLSFLTCYIFFHLLAFLRQLGIKTTNLFSLQKTALCSITINYSIVKFQLEYFMSYKLEKNVEIFRKICCEFFFSFFNRRRKFSIYEKIFFLKNLYQMTEIYELGACVNWKSLLKHFDRSSS